MLFDTDILIWTERGNLKATSMMEETSDRFISIQTYMELLQCTKNKRQHELTKDFLSTFNFSILPLSQNIGHRAAIYVEEYALSSGITAGDAIIAATAIEHHTILVTSHIKHFKLIKELKIKEFKP